MSHYASTFQQLAPGYDPRHIEAYVRLEYSTLSHLPMSTLRREANVARQCIDYSGTENAEALAKSFGL